MRRCRRAAAWWWRRRRPGAGAGAASWSWSWTCAGWCAGSGRCWKGRTRCGCAVRTMKRAVEILQAAQAAELLVAAADMEIGFREFGLNYGSGRDK